MKFAINKKGIFISIAILLLVILAIVLLIVFSKSAGLPSDGNENKDVETISLPMSASWIEQEGGDSETSIINNSLLVAKCKVLSKKVEIVGGSIDGGGVPFTYFTVAIEELYAHDDSEIS
jgi:hypothetical protein